ncbi:MAG: hypothetical protein EBX41_00825 [Chitinophagia bacterium]|nr:hypothetical protein [Chitinophagia bacterium]
MITKEQKKILNVAVPALVAGTAAVLAYRYTKKWEITLGATALAFLLAWAITARITKEAAKSKPKNVDIDRAGAYGYDYDPTALTDALYDDLKPQFLNWARDDASYDKLLSLDNTSLAKVYNDWNNRYYTELKESLPAAIAAEGFLFETTKFKRFTQKALADRFLTAGLN